jgi:cytochrome c-type biogenesis protein
MMDAIVLLSFAYVAGVLSMLAPCSFAMLPSYITFYISREDGKESVSRALLNGTLVTLGGGVVRGSIGVLAMVGLHAASSMGYFSVAVGFILIILGMMMLAGRDLRIPMPVTVNQRKGSIGIFTFGALYSLASMGCTAAIFISVIVTASAEGLTMGLTAITVYIGGMATLLIPLTIAISTSKTLLLDKLEAFMPYVRRVSGIVLLIVGIYLIAYNVWVNKVFD